jgi:hypothetical protein
MTAPNKEQAVGDVSDKVPKTRINQSNSRNQMFFGARMHPKAKQTCFQNSINQLTNQRQVQQFSNSED